MKSKVKGVKFKMQRTYKKELDISKTSKLIIKNVSSNDIGTSNVL
jgi:hypothetical protein